MDQHKVGSFLKELRREKGITQEHLAEAFHTTNRSVSRWENGKTMPDISLLIELADFYDVDVTELIEGERKSENKNEATREAAVKMADYVDEQQSRFLTWLRGMSLMGVLVMVAVLALQTLNYEPGVMSFECYGLSVVAFVVMVILALYANGRLEKISTRKKFFVACKVLVIIAGTAVLSFMINVFALLIVVFLAESEPFQNQSGIENYDKASILENYGGDIDSGLFLFPDETGNMIEPSYEISMKTGLFDSDGYAILQAQYNKEDYDAEVERLSGIECMLEFSDTKVVQTVQYDEESYALPAYVTIDGFDNTYEYALVNEEKCEITYILLCYPNYVDLGPYKECLKLDKSEYEIEDALNQFSIYAHSFDGGQSWMEYSDL